MWPFFRATSESSESPSLALTNSPTAMPPPLPGTSPPISGSPNTPGLQQIFVNRSPSPFSMSTSNPNSPLAETSAETPTQGRGISTAATRRRYTASTTYSFNDNTQGQEVPSEVSAKWMSLLADSGKRWRAVVNSDQMYAHELIRSGIPPELRGEAWKIFSGADINKTKNPGVYQALLEKEMNPKSYEELMRDVHRTFPDHTHFQSKDGRGQQGLINVCKCYSVLDPEVGYCQGMSFMAATLVSQLHEEDAFWTLVALLKNHGLRSLFLQGLPLLKKYVYRHGWLVRSYMPAVARELATIGVRHMFYSVEWYETLFSYCSPFSITLLIWDRILFHGPIYLFRISIALIKGVEEELLGKSFESTMLFLKQLPVNITPHVLEEADKFIGVEELIKKIDLRYDRETESNYVEKVASTS